MKKLEIDKLESINAGGACEVSSGLLVAIGLGVIVGGLLTGGIGAMVIMSYAGMTVTNAYACR